MNSEELKAAILEELSGGGVRVSELGPALRKSSGLRVQRAAIVDALDDLEKAGKTKWHSHTRVWVRTNGKRH